MDPEFLLTTPGNTEFTNISNFHLETYNNVSNQSYAQLTSLFFTSWKNYTLLENYDFSFI